MPNSITQAVQQAAQKIHEVIRELGVDCVFTLRDSNAVFTVPGTLSGFREEDITPGLDQDSRQLTISAQSWRSVSPMRDPEKGDMVVIGGRRHRVMDTTLDAAANIQIRWRLVVKG